jgi:hypothetical protein
MKSLILSKVLIILALVLYPSNTSAQYHKINQLSVGNFFIYDSEIIGSYEKRKYVVVSDTLFEDSITYYKVGQTRTYEQNYYYTFRRLNEKGYYVVRGDNTYPLPHNEFPYYKSRADSGDFWVNPDHEDSTRFIYFNIMGVGPTYKFGQWVTSRALWVEDSSGLWGYMQYWTDEFGVIFEYADYYESWLIGCYIDGVAYGDTNYVVSVDEDDLQNPSEFSLYQNYPNPFNPGTKIKYNISKACIVNLKIFDVMGREVAILQDGFMSPGVYTAAFNADKLASGVYFYRLQAGDFVSTKKMTLIK